MELSLAISPCPNDTFIFDALVHQRIGDGSFTFQLQFGDVEQLNHAAIEGIPDITKVSVGVIPQISENYQILDSGAALGAGCGPILLSKKEYSADQETIENLEIALPGEHTTAHLLLSLAYPGIKKKHFMIFSEIEDAVLNGQVDAGLIIHENRFTYAAKGLKKIRDMGEFWENKFNTPVPLGCIAVKRSLPEALKKEIETLIRQSIQHAFAHPLDSNEFVSQHAQEMRAEVMQQHIDLYVNSFSISLGEHGKSAIRTLLEAAQKSGSHRVLTEPLFV